MPKRAEKVQMSSVIPWWLVQRVSAWTERHLSLRHWDVIYQFWVQTRLIFSKSIVLLVIAQFAFFSYVAIQVFGSLGYRGDQIAQVDEILLLQSIILAIVLHMSLWENEREGRTFELLLMRIPNLHRVIWFKLRVTVFWMTALLMPFFAAFAWFLTIPLWRLALLTVFCLSSALLAVFLTCIVASFVHHGLTSGIIAFILSVIVFSFLSPMSRRYAGGTQWVFNYTYIAIFINPLSDVVDRKYMTASLATRLLIVNRLVLAVAVAGLYRWFFQRLSKIEKWI